jgi:hypothetical protein
LLALISTLSQFASAVVLLIHDLGPNSENHTMGPHSKKRKLNVQVEEITFDPDARQQFLTGFRKRKQQRIKHAQEVAVQKAREAKREDRRKVLEIAVLPFQECN